MAQVCLRRGRIVPGLPDLPEGEGDVAAGGGNTEYPSARAAVHSSPCRLVGLLPTSAEGFKYLFTIIDRSTRWVEAIPVKNMEAATIADALVAGWVSCFGVPAVITSDRSTQFTSAVWEALCKRLNIQHITTTAFHPCSNGMVDRCHRQLKEALRAWLAANDWPDHLPWVLLGMRAAPKEDSAVSSAEMVLGEPLVLPGQPPSRRLSGLTGTRYWGAQPYKAPAAGPIRAPGGAGGVLEHLREERQQPVAIGGVVRRALRGPRARREGVPAAGRRQRGGSVCGPPQTAHAERASAASGAAEARSAARVGRLVHHCRLQMSALRRVLWRHRS